MPIIEIIETYDYKKLLIDYQIENGKKLKPINRRKNSKSKVPNTITCPRCGAPHIYIYDNNGGKGQFQCKICNCNFSYKNRFSKAAIIKCPHCSKPFEKIKTRKDFFVFKCKNNNCSFYINKLTNMSSDERKLFKDKPY